MSEQALIHLDLATRKATITVAAEELIERALESSALIAKVDSEDTNNAATVAQKAVKTALRDLEKARKAAKEGPWELGKSIDAVANAAKADLLAEDDRIGKIMGDFQAAQLAKQRAAEAAARLEAEAAERKRLEELRKLEEARLAEETKLRERERKAAELAAKARSEKARAEAEKLQAEIARQKEIAQAASLEAVDAINEDFSRRNYEASQRILDAKPIQAAGQIVKSDWEIEVVNGYELARYHPQCVEIKPRLLEIKQLLNEGIQVRGVKANKVVKASVRTAGNEVSV